MPKKYDAEVWQGMDALMPSLSACGAVLDDGPPVFGTIQGAVDHIAAKGGGTILLRTGTYVEDVMMSPGVKIIAEDADKTLWHKSVIGNATITEEGLEGRDA